MRPFMLIIWQNKAEVIHQVGLRYYVTDDQHLDVRWPYSGIHPPGSCLHFATASIQYCCLQKANGLWVQVQAGTVGHSLVTGLALQSKCVMLWYKRLGIVVMHAHYKQARDTEYFALVRLPALLESGQ